MDPTGLGAIIGAGAALSGIVLKGVGEFLLELVRERSQRKRQRDERLGVALSHLLEVRTVAVAHVGMRRVLGDWIKEAGGREADADEVFAFVIPSISLPDPGPAYRVAVDALAMDFPVLAWRMRNKEVAVETRTIFARVPPQLAAQMNVVALAVYGEKALETFDELAVDLAEHMGPEVVEDVKRTIAEHSPDAIGRDPEFVRFLEEIKVRMQTMAQAAGALGPAPPRDL
ncbi:MAG: hypothetical protein ACK6CU_01770 [Deltaproteobacteria bacterium]|jgi:hypothetical protein